MIDPTMMGNVSSLPDPKSLVSHATKHPVGREVYQMLAIVFGALVFAIGLEGFLIPNDFLDGGVVGVAIILARFVDLPMGVFVGILNVPFVLLGWRIIGHRAALRSALGIATLSLSTIYLHHRMHAITDQSWLALICGGTMIAVGTGVALRHGGALDGTEVLASILSGRTNYSVGQIILYINICIFTVAGFVISWESALLSAVLFYIVVKDLIDKIAHGESGARQARVITTRYEEVAQVVTMHTKRPVLVDKQKRFYPETGLDEDEAMWVLTFIVGAMEEATLAEDISEVDPNAGISYSNVASLHGPLLDTLNKHTVAAKN